MGDVVEFVVRGTRWSALRHDRAYVADWRARAPFPLRTQTSVDLDAARWGLLAWEDPRTGMAASPFWFDEAMPEGRFVELDDAVATLTELRLLDGVLEQRIARARKSGQVRLREAHAADAVRCDLAMCIALDDEFPETRRAECQFRCPRGTPRTSSRARCFSNMSTSPYGRMTIRRQSISST